MKTKKCLNCCSIIYLGKDKGLCTNSDAERFNRIVNIFNDKCSFYRAYN